MKRRYWTAGEELYLLAFYANEPTEELARVLGRPVSAVYAKAYGLGLAKSAAYFAGPHAKRLGRGQGTATRFRKGQAPWNKGTHFVAGGRSAETRFKVGELAGAVQRKWVPVGTEVVDGEGYLKRKVADDRAVPSRRNWRYVHALLWEEHHGPVPEDYAVTFRNGDRADIRIENLTLITRAELMARNSIQRYPPELRQVMRLAGKLRRTIANVQEAAP